MSSTPPPPVFLGPNPPPPPTHVVVRCPHCKATTKVGLMSPDKATIRCPRCKNEVPLKHARPFRDKVEAPAPAPVPAEAEAKEQPKEPTKEGRRRSRAKVTKNTNPDGGPTVKYPVASQFTFYALLGGGIFVIALVGFLITLVIFDVSAQRDTAYEANLKELLEKHREYLSIIEKAVDLPSANNLRSSIMSLQGRVFALSTVRERMPQPRESERERLKKYEEELTSLQERFRLEEKRVTALLEGKPTPAPIPSGTPLPPGKEVAGQASPPPAKPIETSPVLGAGPRTTPDGVVTGPALPAKAPVAVLPPGTLVLSILNITREQATPQFLDHIASLADTPPGKVTHQWSGDLLTVNVHPVGDPTKFAAKVRFGRPTQFDRAERTLTVLANAAQIVEVGGGSQPPAKDNFSQLLRDLQQEKDPNRRNAAFAALARTKPNDRIVETTHVLEALLKEPDAIVRVNAIRLLPVWSGGDCAPALLRMLEDDAPLVRAAAMDQLGKLNHSPAAEVIAKRCLPRDTDREKATATLVELGEASEPHVLPYLDHADSALRIEACRVLKRVGTAKSLTKLAILAQDANPQLSAAAKDAIGAVAERK